MLHHIAIDLAGSGFFGAAQLFAGASASGQPVDSPRLAKPLKRMSNLVILRKAAEHARIQGMIPDIWGEDDYSAIDGETCVGRIYRERTAVRKFGTVGLRMIRGEGASMTLIRYVRY